MPFRHAVAAALLALAAALLAVVSLDEPAGASPATTAEGARELLDLVNRERAVVGLAPLIWDDDVAAIAAGFAAELAARGELSHNDAFFTPDSRARLRARRLGENVAYDASVIEAHRALMDSPAHRANILDGDFSIVGVGVVRDDRGVVFVTENFVARNAAPAADAAVPAGTPAPTTRSSASRTMPTAGVPVSAPTKVLPPIAELAVARPDPSPAPMSAPPATPTASLDVLIDATDVRHGPATPISPAREPAASDPPNTRSGGRGSNDAALVSASAMAGIVILYRRALHPFPGNGMLRRLRLT